MTHKELREISLSFRRLSSNLLNSTESTASVIIQRFKTYIDGTPIIADIIKRAIDGIDYDYQECFRDHAHGGWSEISPPVDEKCHVKAMYDYLKVIVENGGNVLGVAMSYYHASGKFNDIIRRFLDAAFKPLIDYINDEISKEMILLEEEKAPTMTQNIETVYGTVNQQGNGTIASETYLLSPEAREITALIDRIMPCLDKLPDIPADAIEDVKDDLQSIEEQIKSKEPKGSRLKKGVNGIKKFLSDFSMKLAVSLAASTVTQLDWTTLIAKIEEYIALLHL